MAGTKLSGRPESQRYSQASSRVSGNDAEARKTVMGLVTEMGLQACDVGPAEAARVIESITSMLIRLNIRNKVKGAGIHLTGLPRA